jgi:hypothetical protein
MQCDFPPAGRIGGKIIYEYFLAVFVNRRRIISKKGGEIMCKTCGCKAVKKGKKKASKKRKK